MDKVKKKNVYWFLRFIFLIEYLEKTDADFLNEISKQFLKRLLPQQFTHLLKDSVYV